MQQVNWRTRSALSINLTHKSTAGIYLKIKNKLEIVSTVLKIIPLYSAQVQGSIYSVTILLAYAAKYFSVGCVFYFYLSAPVSLEQCTILALLPQIFLIVLLNFFVCVPTFEVRRTRAPCIFVLFLKASVEPCPSLWSGSLKLLLSFKRTGHNIIRKYKLYKRESRKPHNWSIAR